MAAVKNPRKIYVANISRECTDRDLEKLFSETGRIVVLEHKQDFGFIEYDRDVSAEDAIRKFDGLEYMGKRLVVESYIYRGGDFRYRPSALPNWQKYGGNGDRNGGDRGGDRNGDRNDRNNDYRNRNDRNDRNDRRPMNNDNRDRDYNNRNNYNQHNNNNNNNPRINDYRNRDRSRDREKIHSSDRDRDRDRERDRDRDRVERNDKDKLSSIPRGISYRVYILNLDGSTSYQDVKEFGKIGGNSVCFIDVYNRHGKKEGIIEYSKKDDYEHALKTLDRSRLNGTRVKVLDDRDYQKQKNRSRSSSKPKRSRSQSKSKRNNNNSANSNKDGNDIKNSKNDKLSSPPKHSSRSNSGHNQSRSDSKKRSRSRSNSKAKYQKSPSH